MREGDKGMGCFAPLPVSDIRRLREQVVASVRVTEAWHPANGGSSLHAHGAPTISILLTGTFTEVLGPRSAEVASFHAIARAPGCPHANTFGNGGARVLHLEFERGGIWDPTGPMPEWIRVRKPSLTALALALRGELAQSDTAAHLARESLVAEIVGEFRVARSGDRSGSAPPPWLRRVRELLHDRSHDHFTMTDISREIGVHRVTLAKEFRRHYRNTPAAYVRELRLNRALAAISFDDVSPGRAAVAAGFFDQSHLTRWLKRFAGTTPARMRRIAADEPLPGGSGLAEAGEPVARHAGDHRRPPQRGLHADRTG
jgi:AraC-like DNA-binding protein